MKSESVIQLRGITWDHPRGYDCLAHSGEEWMPDGRVSIAWDKRSLKDFGDLALSELTHRYDLLVIDHPHAGESSASGELLPFDSLLEARTLQALCAEGLGPSFDSYYFAEHQWALPVDAACQMASYRADCLKPSDLPDTWNAFETFAQEVNAAGKRVGMALCPTDALCSFLTLCAQHGDAPSEEARGWIKRETFNEVIAQLRRITSLCVPESLSWNPIRLYEAMASDLEGRLIYAPLAFGYTNYARAGYREYRLGFGVIPGKKHALLGGAGLAVSAHSKHPKLAAEYALWLCSADYQRGSYVSKGGQPAHRAAWFDAEADSLCGGFFSQTRDTLEQAWRRPRFPGWVPFQEFLGDCVHGILSGKLSEDTAWQKLEKLSRTLHSQSNHSAK